MWVLLEAFHEDEDGDEVWLAKTVADADKCGGGCQRRQKVGQMLNSTRFDEDDYLAAVKFYERTERGFDKDRYIFKRGDEGTSYVNGTELRLIVPDSAVTARSPVCFTEDEDK